MPRLVFLTHEKNIFCAIYRRYDTISVEHKGEFQIILCFFPWYKWKSTNICFNRTQDSESRNICSTENKYFRHFIVQPMSKFINFASNELCKHIRTCTCKRPTVIVYDPTPVPTFSTRYIYGQWRHRRKQIFNVNVSKVCHLEWKVEVLTRLIPTSLK